MLSNIGVEISSFLEACTPLAPLFTRLGSPYKRNFVLLGYDSVVAVPLDTEVVYLWSHGLSWVPLSKCGTVDYSFCPCSEVRYRRVHCCFLHEPKKIICVRLNSLFWASSLERAVFGHISVWWSFAKHTQGSVLQIGFCSQLSSFHV